MKKIVAILMLVVFSSISYGQIVSKYVNDMSGESAYVADPSFLILSPDNDDEGIKIQPGFNDINPPTLEMLIVTGVWDGIGCIENGQLIIKFSDETKITSSNWKKFNCENKFYFDIKSSDLEKLFSLTITKVYLENGRTGSNRTFDITGELQNYFIKLGENLKTGNFPIVKY